MKTDAREQILNAAVKLLQEKKEPAGITVRDIAAEAKVQLSMINYYFKSRDELMYRATGVLRDKMAWTRLSAKGHKKSAYTRLREMLIDLCGMSIKYSQYMKFTVEYELTKAEIIMPQYILPMLREICGDKRSELSIRLTAYEIISTLQLIFIRAEDLGNYFGSNILEYERMVEIIDTLLAIHLPIKQTDNRRR